jgi:hypothetical protein
MYDKALIIQGFVVSARHVCAAAFAHLLSHFTAVPRTPEALLPE